MDARNPGNRGDQYWPPMLTGPGPPSDWLTQLGIWLIDSHALTGIPKTMPDHNGVPYSLTEDFITVYRMHPLIP